MTRVAVVTGGGSGMGEATCHELGRRGHRVAVLDLDAGAQRVASDLRPTDATRSSCSGRCHRPARRRGRVRQGARELGPVGHPGDQCRHVRVRAVHRHQPSDVGAGDRRESHGHVPLLPGRDTRHGDRELGPHRDDFVVERAAGISVDGTLRGRQRRGDRADQIAGPRIRHGGITVNNIPPSGIETPMQHQSQAAGKLPSNEQMASQHPARATWAPATTSQPPSGSCARKRQGSSPGKSSESMAER